MAWRRRLPLLLVVSAPLLLCSSVAMARAYVPSSSDDQSLASPELGVPPRRRAALRGVQADVPAERGLLAPGPEEEEPEIVGKDCEEDCKDTARSAYRAAFRNIERAFAQPCDEDPSSWTARVFERDQTDERLSALQADAIEKARVEAGHLFANHSFVFLVGEPFSGTSALQYFIASASNVRTPCFGTPSVWQCEDRDPERDKPAHDPVPWGYGALETGHWEERVVHLRTLADKVWRLSDIPPDGPRILFSKVWHRMLYDHEGYTHTFEPLATALSRIGVARDRIFFIALSRSLFTMHRSGKHSVSQKQWRWYAKHNVALINDTSLNVLQVKYEDLIGDWHKVRDAIEAFVPGLAIAPENASAWHAGFKNPGKRTAHGILRPENLTEQQILRKSHKGGRKANVVEFAETHAVNRTLIQNYPVEDVFPWDWHPNKETARVLEELGYEHGKHWRAVASWGGKATC